MVNVTIGGLTNEPAPLLTAMVEIETAAGAARRADLANIMLRAYGGISIDDGAALQTLVASTWTKLTQFDTDTPAGATLNTTPAHASDKVTLTNAGVYMVGFSASFTTGATSVVDLAIYWNGSITTCRGEVTSPDGTTIMNVAASYLWHANLAAKDLELWVRGTAADDLACTQLNLHAHRIG